MSDATLRLKYSDSSYGNKSYDAFVQHPYTSIPMFTFFFHLEHDQKISIEKGICYVHTATRQILIITTVSNHLRCSFGTGSDLSAVIIIHLALVMIISIGR